MEKAKSKPLPVVPGFDFNTIETFLKKNFAHVKGDFGGNAGLGKSYLIGTNPDSVVKLDIYYSMDPFFQKLAENNEVRMATIEEIIAMKNCWTNILSTI